MDRDTTSCHSVPHGRKGAFDDLPIDDFENQIKVNYLSAVYATRCVVPGMKSRRNGHISFVSSAAGQCAIYGYTAYAPTKFALRSGYPPTCSFLDGL
ncbi:unnamed protein product [Heligmosomoides polygyrus]|uniref:3-ketodihydrosphingosine reductase tsc10 n=1 Tax=Heligmosomoides polygyrus TaxID=6339 RepID=A0A183GX41_HELPZ|nr:unnamed protein product [Heligmosomoides polygyrus]